MTKKILLYSGGMDSYLADKLWKPDIKVYVDCKSEYSKAEVNHLAVPSDIVMVSSALNLETFERDDAIIPYRNLYFLTVAANIAEIYWPLETYPDIDCIEIGLGATAGDRVLDKSPEFAEMFGEVLTLLNRPQHWTGGNARQIKVVLPVKNFTKADMVHNYLVQEMKEDRSADKAMERLNRETFSCYSPQLGAPCWRCKPCFRKWVALTLNGYKGFGPGTDSAVRSYITDSILPQIENGTYGREQESNEILDAMKI